MFFDVDSLNTEEVLATKVILEKLQCTHPKLACVDCPCFEICIFLHKITDKCKDVLEERAFSFKSSAYTKDDAIFVADVINRGLCGFCEQYSSYYEPQDMDCEGCPNKTACTDLQSAYHYMRAKALRMFTEDQTGKTVPYESELPDS